MMWIRLRRNSIQDQFNKDLEDYLREHAEESEEEIDLYDRLVETKEVWREGGKEGLKEYLKKLEEEPPIPEGIKRWG